MKLLSVIVVFLLIWPGDSWAKQLHFSKTDTEDTVQFSYQWLDQEEQRQSLSFTMDKVMIFNRFREFKRYSPAHAKKLVDQKIRRALIKSPLDNVKVSFKGTGNDLKFELQGESQLAITQAYATITELEKEYMQALLAQSFYTQFISFDNSLAIKPDHVRFAQTSADDFAMLKDLILESVPAQSVRNVANYVLGFVQSIPYSTLESRVSSTGAGFNPPLQTLWQNQGDCDSKVTLSAAIYRALMPRMKMMLVFIDNHALLAMNIEPEANELTITVDGLHYILAEPTGPAMMHFGEISTDSEFAIRNGRYYAEPFLGN